MKKNTKKSVSIVAVIVIIATMSMGAYAYFTDYATSTKTATAATLDVILMDVTTDLTAGKGIIIPGESNDLKFTVANVAEKAVDIKAVITVTATNGSGEVMGMSESDREYKITTNDGIELKGSQVAGSTVYTVEDIALSGSAEKDILPKAGIITTYDYQIEMDEDAGHEWQGSNVLVKIEIYAKQRSNTEHMTDDWHKSSELTIG